MASVEQECVAANVEENDYTIFTHQDLQFELELVVQGVVKKIAFIENQVGLISLPTCIYLLVLVVDCCPEYEQPDSSTARTVREYL